jgi:hypothetical protein
VAFWLVWLWWRFSIVKGIGAAHSGTSKIRVLRHSERWAVGSLCL